MNQSKFGELIDTMDPEDFDNLIRMARHAKDRVRQKNAELKWKSLLSFLREMEEKYGVFFLDEEKDPSAEAMDAMGILLLSLSLANHIVQLTA